MLKDFQFFCYMRLRTCSIPLNGNGKWIISKIRSFAIFKFHLFRLAPEPTLVENDQEMRLPYCLILFSFGQRR